MSGIQCLPPNLPVLRGDRSDMLWFTHAVAVAWSVCQVHEGLVYRGRGAKSKRFGGEGVLSLERSRGLREVVQKEEIFLKG